MSDTPSVPTPSPLSFEAHLAESLARLDRAGLTRSTDSRTPEDAIDLTGNDVLGFGRDKELRTRFFHWLDAQAEPSLGDALDDAWEDEDDLNAEDDENGEENQGNQGNQDVQADEEDAPDASDPLDELRFGSGASRILGGDADVFRRLEAKLGEMFGRPGGVLLFQSGWHANSGILPALAAVAPKRTAFVADREVHASMIDGITMLRAQGVRVERFRHNDFNHLEHFVTKLEAEHNVVWVALESLYSMSGDVAPLHLLPELKARHPKMRVILDEAHAFGAWGPGGRGLAEEADVLSAVDVLIGTLGKAWAAVGAFAAATPEIRTWLVSRHRPFIYSTAMPPAEALWVEFLMGATDLLEKRRIELAQICGIFGKRHIVPVAFETVEELFAARDELLKKGFAAAAVRPPTVRKPQLRLSLSAAIRPEEALKLKRVLERLQKRFAQVRLAQAVAGTEMGTETEASE